MLGCLLCIVGSMTIVLHAPPEREIHSVLEVWALAMQPCEWREGPRQLLLWRSLLLLPSYGAAGVLHIAMTVCAKACMPLVAPPTCKAGGSALLLAMLGSFAQMPLCLCSTWNGPLRC